MATKNGQKQPGRPTVFIGGAGPLPVMAESQILPERSGNDFTCLFSLDTPDKRYLLDLILSQEGYDLFREQRGRARIEKICGTVEEGESKLTVLEINGKPTECRERDDVIKADENTPPMHGYFCAATLAGVGVLFPQVKIEELPEETRCAYLNTLTREKIDPPAQRGKAKGRTRIDYKKRKPNMEEWGIAETIMGGMIFKAKEITPYAIKKAMPDQWMKHPRLAKVRLPDESTFKNIATEMKINGRIRRAHPRKDNVRI